MFFVCGSATVIVGIVFLIAIPKDTSTAWLFTEEEHKVPTEQLVLDQSIRDRAKFSINPFKEAVTFGYRKHIYFLIRVLICLPSPILKFSTSTASDIPSSKPCWNASIGISTSSDMPDWKYAL
ncbi:hypothetical protein FQN50_004277 [Emmonsiellopsis sp. PD_5]|nr:hypothetical protein FQN50_004277 [Emmonsiellopsis sp. PD_5]